MNVLVTGGGGFIGKSLIKQLIARQYNVSSYSRSFHAELEAMSVTQIRGDIRDKVTLSKACHKMDVVFHIAAKVGFWGSHKDFHETNVGGSENVVAACLDQGVKYLIFTSSASVVFGGQDICGGDESLPYPKQLVSNYTATKAMAEKIVIAANGSQVRSLSLRPHLVWGLGDNHLMPRILKKAREGRLFKIGNRDTLIDTTHIDNYTHAQLMAFDALRNDPKAGGQAYFITDGRPIKTWDFVNALLHAHGLAEVDRSIPKHIALKVSQLMVLWHKVFLSKKEPTLSPFIVNELCTSHWFDISKAKKILSYEAQTTFEEGMRTIEAFSGKIEA